MTRLASTFMAVVIAAAAVAVVPAQQAAQLDKLFASAQHQETVEGNLKGAIDSYQQVVSRAGTNRALAAQALLRIADCYQKLGHAQSRGVYERIVREYSDQKEAAATARARLGAPASPGGRIANVQVWTGPKVDTLGGVSPDGRYLSFVDWETGDLAVHDLIAGTDRRVTNKGTYQQSSDFAEQSAISSDGAQVAYAWWSQASDRYQLRVTNLNGAVAASRTLIDDPAITWVAPYEWSRDGKWIAVTVSRRDRTEQIGLVSYPEGALRVVKNIDSRGANRLALSSDGQWLAYDVAPNATASHHDIFMVRTDGSREIPLVQTPAHDVVVAWSADGRTLLVGSDRGGARGLWALPINGEQVGTPTLVKPDLAARLSSLGISRTGKLVYGLNTSARNIHVAELDFESGRLLAPPKALTDGYLFNSAQAAWSPDGRTVVFKAARSGNASTLSFISVDTEQVREVRPAMNGFARPRWAHDGAITVQGEDLTGRNGIFLIDAQTGGATPLVTDDNGSVLQGSWSRDRRYFVFRRMSPKGQSVVVRDTGTGAERDIVTTKGLSGVTVSPTGREIAYLSSNVLHVVSIDGVSDRTVYTARGQHGLPNYTEWTPDGSRIVFAESRTGADEPTVLWSVSSAGGAPVRLDIEIESVGGLLNPQISPTGRRLVYTAGNVGSEIWTLENFLPASAK